MLKDEITGMWGMEEVLVIPVVLGVLGAISTGFEKYIVAIGIEMRVEHAQKTALLGTASILILVLEKKKEKHHHKCHCAGLCEIFDNRLLFALTESAGATNNNALSIINNNDNDNNTDNNNEDK